MIIRNKIVESNYIYDFSKNTPLRLKYNFFLIKQKLSILLTVPKILINKKIISFAK